MTGCVYRMYDANDGLLYVGCTVGLVSRIANHERDREWWGDVARVTVTHYEDIEEAARAEKQAIATEAPRHNVQHQTDSTVLARRRKQRQRQQAAWEERMYEMNTWDPEGSVVCTNCGRRPERMPTRRTLDQLVCQRCRVAALVLVEKEAA